MPLKAEKPRDSACTHIPPKTLKLAVPTTPGTEVPHYEGKVFYLRPKGRPSKYRDEFVDMMISFFDIEVERTIEVEVVDKNGDVTMQQKLVLNTFPTFGRFATKIGVSTDTLRDWATAMNHDGTMRRPDFAFAYARAKDLQEALLIEGGISGAYDRRFACQFSQCILGWKY